MTDPTSMNVRVVEQIHGHDVIEVRSQGKRYRRWNGHHFVCAEHYGSKAGGATRAFEITREQTVKALIDAEIDAAEVECL